MCSLCRCCWHSCLLCSVLAAPTVRATRVCPTYYVLLLPFLRASAICVCAKSHARCPSTSLVLLFPSLPCAPYTTFPHALTLHVCSARYLQPPPYVPCVSARHLLCPSLAFPTSFCHLCLRKVSCAFPQHVISPSLPLPSICAVYNIPSRTHTEPAPQCRTWPSTLAG